MSCNEDETVHVDLSAYTSDPEGDPLFYSLTGQLGYGSAQLSGSVLTYTPPKDWNSSCGGRVRGQYKVFDGKDGWAFGEVTINVRPVNDPPQVSVEPGGTVDVRKGEGVMFVFSVSDIDFECEGDIIAWAIKDGPAHGEVRPGPWVPITQPDIVDVLYIAARDYCCQDSFTIECVDRGGKTGQATAWVNIVNDPPAFDREGLEGSLGIHVPGGGGMV
jgi:hypothetical protein